MPDEIVDRVPDWVLRNLLFPRGQRLPKMVLLRDKEDKSRQLLGRIIHGIVPARTLGPAKSAESVLGNLEPHMYQFWVGSEYEASQFARCRACKTSEFDEARRKMHQPPLPGDKCTVVLVKAYKKLHAQGKCVVCERHSYEFRWGIPVHKHCEKLWMFSLNDYPLLRKAIAEVRDIL